MTTTVLPQPTEARAAPPGAIRVSIALALTAWFLLVVALGAENAFGGRPGSPPIAIAFGVAAPLLLFFAWLRLSRSFRDFVLSLDLRFIAGMQAWRWAGLGFLFLYAYKVLPAMFALPAGLGNMSVGFAAPWIILGLARQPKFAAGKAFIRWNVLGIADLILALGLGAAGAWFPGKVSSAPMATLPLLVVPAYLVPLFLMLHITALMQSRRLIRAAHKISGG